MNLIQTEKDVMEMIRNITSYRKDIQLFRNNVGVAAAYNFKTRSLRKPLQIIRYGLTQGSGDFIGYKTVEIKPDDVGKKVAVFLSVEAKNPNKHLISEEQKQFQEQVNNDGGIALIVKNMEDLKEIL
jgi:hypothetical protein